MRFGAHNVASHAIPTSDPVGHPLIRCHKPMLSFPLLPRHCENIERRLSSAALAQGTFHGAVESTVDGHLDHPHHITRRGMMREINSRLVLHLKFDNTKANIKSTLQATRQYIPIGRTTENKPCTRHLQNSSCSEFAALHLLVRYMSRHKCNPQLHPCKSMCT
jgi:hypothetical protein